MRSNTATHLAVSLTIFTLFAANPVLGQCERQKLLASPGATREYFGHALDVRDGLLVVGAPNNTVQGTLSGAAYVYRDDGAGWNQEAVLYPVSPVPYQLFGYSVGVSGDAIVVGTPNLGDLPEALLAGGAQVFRFDGLEWFPEAALVPSGCSSLTYCGRSVGIDGDVVVVGAPGEWDQLNFGAAYAFRFDGVGWVEEGRLVAWDTDVYSRFGWSVSVRGDVIAVGNFEDTSVDTAAGSVYVFRYNGSSWLPDQKLIASDYSQADEFGWAVDVWGDTILVGTPWDRDQGSRSGSAYVFRHDGAEWVEEAKLLPADGGPEEYFGWSVGIDDSTAVVSTHFDGANGPQSGSVHVFRHDGASWMEDTELVSSDGAAGDYLGHALGITGTTIAAAAPRDDDYGIQSGSVYVFGPCPGGEADAPSPRPGRIESQTAFAPPPAPSVRTLVGTSRGGGPGMGAAAAALVSEDSYRQFLDESLYTHFGDNRGIFGPEHNLARDRIAAIMSSYGLDVSLERVGPLLWYTFDNVVGTKWGRTYPDEEYIVGAHYDSEFNSGTDDNATGVALVLEAARVLSSFDSDRTIRFVAFDTEEWGLVGSWEYNSAHYGDNILGMVSADMVAYNNGENVVRIGCGPNSQTLEAALVTATTDYGNGLSASLIGQHFHSDQAPFEAYDLEACYFSETELDPIFHTIFDTFDLTDHLDYAYATQLTRIIVGYLVDHAGVSLCAQPEPIFHDPAVPDMNRFLALTPGNPGERTAIRVQLTSLYHPDPPPISGETPDFSAYEGEYRWVGPPQILPEFNETGPPFSQPTWIGAMLQCEPYFADWTSLGTTLHVYGAEVLPESTYDVQQVRELCADQLEDESLYSTAVELRTGRWGDVTALYAGPGTPPQPDFVDISAVVAKFVGELEPRKVQAMLRLNVPPVTDNINFKDIAATVAAFMQEAYPYDGPCTCPSGVLCPDVDLCGRCTP